MSLQYPFPEVPAPGTTLEVAPGIHWLSMPLPFQLDHINLWLLEEDEGWTVIDTASATRRRARLWEQDSPEQDGKAGDRHALPPRPRRQRRLAVPALRRRALDDAGRIPDGARGALVDRRLHHRCRAVGVPQERPRRAARVRHGRTRQPLRRAGAGVSAVVPAHHRGRPDRDRQAPLARHRRPRPCARAPFALLRRTSTR